MSDLIHLRTFNETGNIKREKEDLTYMSFKCLRQENAASPISFFRSDFRGSSFSDCHFFKNNFDRADFIACIFENCSFTGTNIAASEMKNCYFKNVIFSNNQYNHASIQESTFENCEFIDENLLVNMKNCKFINCRLKSCTFERSTTESVTFLNSMITDSDMATMHAERHRFSCCQIDNTAMDINYIFSYSFNNTDLSNIKVLYRGDTIQLTRDAISHRANMLWREHRFYEFLNANILCGNIKEVPQIMYNILNGIFGVAQPLRKLEISELFDILRFYTNNHVFSYSIYLKIIDCLESFDRRKFSSEERLIFLTGYETLKLYVKDGCYNEEFVLTAAGAQSTIIIHCNTDDYDVAIKATNEFLSDISAALGVPCDFELVDAQKGSWILTFAVISAMALIIPKIVSETVNVSMEISTKTQIKKIVSTKLKKKNLSTDELKALADVATNTGLVKGSSFQVTPANLIDALKIQL